MKKGLLLSLLSPLALQGCFFVFIPGSAIAKLHDVVTGERGTQCVPPVSRVGDVVKLPNGRRAIIKEISGESSRCPTPERPIRVVVEEVKNV